MNYTIPFNFVKDQFFRNIIHNNISHDNFNIDFVIYVSLSFIKLKVGVFKIESNHSQMIKLIQKIENYKI